MSEYGNIKAPTDISRIRFKYVLDWRMAGAATKCRRESFSELSELTKFVRKFLMCKCKHGNKIRTDIIQYGISEFECERKDGKTGIWCSITVSRWTA